MAHGVGWLTSHLTHLRSAFREAWSLRVVCVKPPTYRIVLRARPESNCTLTKGVEGAAGHSHGIKANIVSPASTHHAVKLPAKPPLSCYPYFVLRATHLRNSPSCPASQRMPGVAAEQVVEKRKRQTQCLFRG